MYQTAFTKEQALLFLLAAFNNRIDVMAIEIKQETLKEIAENLDMGNLCFYHKTTGEVESYPQDLEFSGVEEMWEDVTGKVESNIEDYIEFEPMTSRDTFKVIENFINTISHVPTQNRFIGAISRKKPFANFNDLLHDYPDLRQQWFTFKLEKYIPFVKAQLEYLDEDE
jgi:translation elongation factor EF-G